MSKTFKAEFLITGNSSSGVKAAQRQQNELSKLNTTLGKSKGAFSSYGSAVSTSSRNGGRFASQQRLMQVETVQLNRAVAGLGATLSAVFGIEGGKYLLNQADNYHALQQRIGVATRATGDFNEMSERLFDMTQKTGTSLSATALAFQRISTSRENLGATNEEILRFVDGMNKLGSISGSKAGEFNGAMIQMAQGLSSFKVQAQEARSVVEAIPAIEPILAKAFNVSPGQFIQQVVKEEKATGEQIFAAILNAMNDIDEQFEAIEQRLSQSYERVGNSFQKLVGSMNVEAEGTKTISANLDEISTYFEDLSVDSDRLRANMDLATNSAGLFAAVIGGRVLSSLAAYRAEKLKGRKISIADRAQKLFDIKHETYVAKAALSSAEIEVAASHDKIAAKKQVHLAAVQEHKDAKQRLTDLKAQKAVEQHLSGKKVNVSKAVGYAAANREVIAARREIVTTQLAYNAEMKKGNKLSRIAAAAKTREFKAINNAKNATLALGVAQKGLNGLYSLAGGWIGLVTIAAYGLYSYADSIETATEKLERLNKVNEDAKNGILESLSDDGPGLENMALFKKTAQKEELDRLKEEQEDIISRQKNPKVGIQGLVERYNDGERLEEINNLLLEGEHAYGGYTRALSLLIATRRAEEEKDGTEAIKRRSEAYIELRDTLFPLEAKMREYNEQIKIIGELEKSEPEEAARAYKALAAYIVENSDAVKALKKAEKAESEEKARQVESNKKYIEQLEYEVTLIGKTAKEKKILLELRDKKIEDGSSDADRIRAATDAIIADEEFVKKQEENAERLASTWEESGKRINETFADAFTGAFDSFDSFSDQLLDGFKRLLGELAYQSTLQPIILEFTQGFSGAIGSGVGAGAAKAASTTATDIGASAAFSYGANAYLSPATSTVPAAAGTTALGLPHLAAAAAVIAIGKEGWDRDGWQGLAENAFLGPLAGKIVGGGHSVSDDGVRFGVQDGQIFGDTYRQIKTDGGYISKDRYRYESGAFDEEFQQTISKTHDEIYSSTIAMLRGLGESVSGDALEGFAYFDELSFDGLNETEIQEKIQQFFVDMGSAALDYIDIGDFKDLEDLVNFTQIKGQFDSSFLSDEEKLTNLTDSLSASFDDMGRTLPETSNELRALTDEFDLLTKSGRDQFTEIAKLTPALDAYYSQLEGLEKEKNDKEINRVSELNALLSGFSTDASTLGMSDFRKSLFDLTIQLFESFKAIKDLGGTLADSGDVVAIYNSEVSALNASLEGQIVKMKGELFGDPLDDLIADEQQALRDLQDAEREFHAQRMDHYNAALEAEKQLADFAQSLQVGELSTLTDRDKSTEALSQFSGLEAKALNGDAGAASELAQAASTYLELQRTLYASSSTYTDSFVDINKRLTAVQTSIGGISNPGDLSITESSSDLDFLLTGKASIDDRETAKTLLAMIEDYSTANKISASDYSESVGIDLTKLSTAAIGGLTETPDGFGSQLEFILLFNKLLDNASTVGGKDSELLADNIAKGLEDLGNQIENSSDSSDEIKEDLGEKIDMLNKTLNDAIESLKLEFSSSNKRVA